MGIFNLLALPVRILNIPVKIVEKVVLDDQVGLDEPLDELADSIEELDEL